MRKDSKATTRVNVARVQGYHGGNYHSESYAFEGYESNKYFASDRGVPLDSNFNRLDGKPLNCVGLEIETECFGVKNERMYAEVLRRAVFPLFPPDLFKMQHDGSLGVDDSYDFDECAIGIECITQPMTKAFVRNHYKDFKAMYNTLFPALEISCSRSGNCGMHVNISNAMFGDTRAKQIEALRKLHYFVNKNFRLSCLLFKRDPDSVGYCGRMDYSNPESYSIGGGDHYHCLNYSHFHVGRVELRLVGGQPDYYAFRNTMETVFFLIDRMKSIKWADLYSGDMFKVFKGCNQYVVKRLDECELNQATLEKIKEHVKEADFELC